MPDTDTAALESVPFRVTDPERIPSKRYYDEAFYELEKEKLWPHVWQMACRLEEIPEVGDYVEYSNLGKSVIVVRTKEGVKAFHNACRHRGVQLVEGRGNCKTKGFICPFHGWRWSPEGENTFVFGKQIFSAEALNKAELNLVPCRLETAVGCAFINFDDDAPSLEEVMRPVIERMRMHNWDKLEMKWWYGTVLPTNWKLAMEAFMEGYHVMRTHPQLLGGGFPNPFGEDVGGSTRMASGKEIGPLIARSMARLGTGMGGQISPREVAVLEDIKTMDLPEDTMQATGIFFAHFLEEVTRRGREEGLEVPDMPAMMADNPHKNVEFLFPHFFFVPSFSAMSSYRIRPLSPETCFFEIWSLDYFKEGEHERPLEPIILPYNSDDFPEIPKQDYANLPRQQVGLHAEGFEYMRLSHQFEGMISNYQRLIDGYLAGLDKEKLAAGARAVNIGYDCPIVDIGF